MDEPGEYGGEDFEGADAGVDPDDPDAQKEFNMHDAILFVIDVTEPMIRHKFASGGLPFAYVAMEAAIECMTDRVLSSGKDLVGVLLYGTKDHSNAMDFKHVWELVKLAEPSAKTIRMLKHRVKNVEVFGEAELKECGGSVAGGVNLRDVLLCSQLALQKDSARRARKRIFLFTCDEQRGASQSALDDARIKAADMRGSDALTEIRIEPFFLCPPSTECFDTDVFWRAVIVANRGEEDGASSDALRAGGAAPAELALTVCDRDASALQGLARRASAKKRAYTNLPMVLPDGHEIGLTLYTLVSKRAKPPARKLVAETNEAVVMKTRQLNAADGQVLGDQYDIGHLFPVGNRNAIFESGERAKLNSAFGHTRLALIGFKSRERLKPYHSKKSGYFAVPNEASLSGSTAASRALIEELCARDKMAVGMYIARQAVSMVALLPQQEVRAADGAVSLPFGFHVLPLPFADDVRAPPLVYGPAEPSAEAVAGARALVDAMRIPYEPRKNPVLERFYTGLEAYALAETNVAQVEDHTLPDAQLVERCAPQAEEFKAAVFGDEYAEPQAGGAARKRAAAAGDAGGTKRLKGGAPETAREWRDLANADQLGQLTAPILKGYCDQHSLKKGGKKDELAARVRDHILSAGTDEG